MKSLGAVPLPVLVLACSLSAAPALAAEFPQPGEWPCFRRDGGLLARSPARGSISEPRLVWKQFVGTLDTERVDERELREKLLQSHGGRLDRFHGEGVIRGFFFVRLHLFYLALFFVFMFLFCPARTGGLRRPVRGKAKH